MLDVQGLSGGYGGIDVLHDVSISVEAGETVTILGANTAGKSSLMCAISGLLPRVSGRITFNGADLSTQAAHDIPGLGIAHVPEGRHVFKEMSVEQNLMCGAYCARDRVDARARLDVVFDLFPRLMERRKQAAGSMSGGEQQMVAIGRAMMSDPSLILMDEPSLGLAPIVVDSVHEAMGRINALGVAILLVEQNAVMALSVARRGYVLESGRLVLSGDAAALRDDPGVKRAYLGV